MVQQPVQHLRVSITPKCNYQCFVCDHEGNDSEKSPMQTNELIHLVRLFVEVLGIDSIKLTGGEPLCAPDIVDITSYIKKIPGVRDLSMTTNGSLLVQKAGALKEAGLDRLNISIWSLYPKTYEEITGTDGLSRVLEGLAVVNELHFEQVKLNYTLLRNYNVAEFWDMLELARSYNFTLQLIELHKVEKINPDFVFEQERITIPEIEAIFLPYVKSNHKRAEMQNRNVYHLSNGATIETVAMGPDTCAHCSKIRLTYDGKIKPCLLRNESNVDLLEKLREGLDDEQLKAVIVDTTKLRHPYFT